MPETSSPSAKVAFESVASAKFALVMEASRKSALSMVRSSKKLQRSSSALFSSVVPPPRSQVVLTLEKFVSVTVAPLNRVPAIKAPEKLLRSIFKFRMSTPRRSEVFVRARPSTVVVAIPGISCPIRMHDHSFISTLTCMHGSARVEIVVSVNVAPRKSASVKMYSSDASIGEKRTAVRSAPWKFAPTKVEHSLVGAPPRTETLMH